MRFLTSSRCVFHLIALLAATSCAAEERGGDRPSALPAVVLRSLEGRYVYLHDFCYPGPESARKPRCVLVLNFMSTDCVPCKKELPQLVEVMKAYNGKGVRAFLVSTDAIDKEVEVRRMTRDFKVEFGVLLDPYKVACGKLGINRVPVTLIVGPTGRISGELTGATDGYADMLKKELDKALASR